MTMNTREREVMEAVVLAARRMLAEIDDMGCNTECRYLRSSVATLDALLAEGSASSEGAEAEMHAFAESLAAAQKPFDPDVARAIRDNWRKLFDDDTFSQPAQSEPATVAAHGEHEQRSCEGSEPELERYGIEWRGPHMPIALPMPDGYWTPWHIAEAALKQRTSERQTNAIENAFYEAQGDIFTTETRWGEVSAWIAARAKEQRISERRPIAESDVSRACEVFDAATFYSIGGYTFDDYRKRMRAALESALPSGLPAGSDDAGSERERLALLGFVATDNTAEQPSCGQDARDAARYRIVRRKVGIVSGKTPEFVIMNLRPVHIAPDAAIELDAVTDAAIAVQQRQGDTP